MYLDEMKAQLEKNSSTTFSSKPLAHFKSQTTQLKSFSVLCMTEKQLVAIIQDLFGAGSATSSSSIGLLINDIPHDG